MSIQSFACYMEKEEKSLKEGLKAIKTMQNLNGSGATAATPLWDEEQEEQLSKVFQVVVPYQQQH